MLLRPKKVYYQTPEGTICRCCRIPCNVVPLDNSFDYAGTHCTGGVGGVHYPAGYGSPASDCCGDDCLNADGDILERKDVEYEPDWGV